MIDPRIIVAHARNTGKLKLSFGGAFEYYWAHILFAPLVLDILFALNWETYLLEPLLIIHSITIVIFLCIYFGRRSALEFTVIKTKLTREQFMLMMKEVIKYYDWEIEVFEPDIIIADDFKVVDRDFDPPIEYTHFIGQRVTIVIDHNKVYVNSILNMQRWSRTRERGSKSAENVEIIREEITMEEDFLRDSLDFSTEAIK